MGSRFLDRHGTSKTGNSMRNCNLQMEVQIPLGSRFGFTKRVIPNLQFAICNVQSAILLSILIHLGPSLKLLAESPAIEAPLVGRKEPFCGAIGSGNLRVSTSATPTMT